MGQPCEMFLEQQFSNKSDRILQGTFSYVGGHLLVVTTWERRLFATGFLQMEVISSMTSTGFNSQQDLKHMGCVLTMTLNDWSTCVVGQSLGCSLPSIPQELYSEGSPTEAIEVIVHDIMEPTSTPFPLLRVLEWWFPACGLESKNLGLFQDHPSYLLA